MIKLYALMTIISTFVRQFYLPNPFESFGDNAFIINIIAEPILHLIAYGIVGLFYSKGSAPIVGSILYLIAYALLIGFLWILGIFNFAWWWILLIVAIAFAIIFGIRYVANMIFDF